MILAVRSIEYQAFVHGHPFLFSLCLTSHGLSQCLSDSARFGKQFTAAGVKRAGVIPKAWDWPLFLETAAGLLPFTFARFEAVTKWGLDSTISLRDVGNMVFGALMPSNCLMEEALLIVNDDRHDDHRAFHELFDSLLGAPEDLSKATSKLLVADIGPSRAWEDFFYKLELELYDGEE